MGARRRESHPEHATRGEKEGGVGGKNPNHANILKMNYLDGGQYGSYPVG